MGDNLAEVLDADRTAGTAVSGRSTDRHADRARGRTAARNRQRAAPPARAAAPADRLGEDGR